MSPSFELLLKDLSYLARGTHLSEGQLEDPLQFICRSAAESLHVARVNIWLFDESHQKIICIHSWQPENEPSMKGEILQAQDFPLYFEALEKLRVVKVHDLIDEPMTQELKRSYLGRFGIGTMIDAPVYSRGEVVGVVCHEHYGAARMWQPEEVAFAGSIADFVSIALETDRRIQSENANLALQLKLLRTDRLQCLGVMTGGIVHDFKNFLAIIQSNAQLALFDNDIPESVKKRMEDIMKATGDAAGLCRELLRFSTNKPVELSVLNLTAEVQEILKVLAKSVPRGVTLSVTIPDKIIPVKAVSMMIKQIMMNLVLNAVEALNDGKGTVNVSLKEGAIESSLRDLANPPLEKNRDYVVICVSDNGCGMSDEVKASLFEPFVTTKYSGHGLGMMNVMHQLNEIDGSIAVRSVFGQGTDIFVFFPVCASQS